MIYHVRVELKRITKSADVAQRKLLVWFSVLNGAEWSFSSQVFEKFEERSRTREVERVYIMHWSVNEVREWRSWTEQIMEGFCGAQDLRHQQVSTIPSVTDETHTPEENINNHFCCLATMSYVRACLVYAVKCRVCGLSFCFNERVCAVAAEFILPITSVCSLPWLMLYSAFKVADYFIYAALASSVFIFDCCHFA